LSFARLLEIFAGFFAGLDAGRNSQPSVYLTSNSCGSDAQPGPQPEWIHNAIVHNSAQSPLRFRDCARGLLNLSNNLTARLLLNASGHAEDSQEEQEASVALDDNSLHSGNSVPF
jgi:hypothetical protein